MSTSRIVYAIEILPHGPVFHVTGASEFHALIRRLRLEHGSQSRFRVRSIRVARDSKTQSGDSMKPLKAGSTEESPS